MSRSPSIVFLSLQAIQLLSTSKASNFTDCGKYSDFTGFLLLRNHASSKPICAGRRGTAVMKRELVFHWLTKIREPSSIDAVKCKHRRL
jgi:hypothetical protein